MSSLPGIVFAVLAVFTRGIVSVSFVALLGLANSLIWPSIWPLAIADPGKFTKIGSSLLVMAISGAAILPLVYGWITDHANSQLAYWIVVLCYPGNMLLFHLGSYRQNEKQQSTRFRYSINGLTPCAYYRRP